MMEIVEVSEDEGNNEIPDNTSFLPSAGPMMSLMGGLAQKFVRLSARSLIFIKDAPEAKTNEQIADELIAKKWDPKIGRKVLLQRVKDHRKAKPGDKPRRVATIFVQTRQLREAVTAEKVAERSTAIAAHTAEFETILSDAGVENGVVKAGVDLQSLINRSMAVMDKLELLIIDPLQSNADAGVVIGRAANLVMLLVQVDPLSDAAKRALQRVRPVPCPLLMAPEPGPTLAGAKLKPVGGSSSRSTGASAIAHVEKSLREHVAGLSKQIRFVQELHGRAIKPLRTNQETEVEMILVGNSAVLSRFAEANTAFDRAVLTAEECAVVVKSMMTVVNPTHFQVGGASGVPVAHCFLGAARQDELSVQVHLGPRCPHLERLHTARWGGLLLRPPSLAVSSVEM